jgi:hypothetical protein
MNVNVNVEEEEEYVLGFGLDPTISIYIIATVFSPHL